MKPTSEQRAYPKTVVVDKRQVCDLLGDPEAGDVDLRIVNVVDKDMGGMIRLARATEYPSKSIPYSSVGLDGGCAFRKTKEPRYGHVLYPERYGATELCIRNRR